jgi:hypothetical protein
MQTFSPSVRHRTECFYGLLLRIVARDSTAARGMASSIGISVMPHFGQLPGASRTISGCIGQV